MQVVHEFPYINDPEAQLAFGTQQEQVEMLCKVVQTETMH